MELNEEGPDAAPAADEFDLVDSLLAKADNQTPGSDGGEADEPEGDDEDQDDESPEEDADDQLDAEEDGEEGQEIDVKEDEGDLDEEEDEEEDEGEEEGDQESEEGEDADLGAGRLSAKEMATIKASPELSKAYRSMQAALTVKTQALAEQRRELETASGELEAERGEVLEAKEVLDAFIAQLEDKKPGGGREQALIGMALDDPELFQRAFDAVADMTEDPEKLKVYKADQKRRGEDADRDRRERELAKAEQKNFGQHANRLTKVAAERLKLDEAGQELAAEFVADAIRASVVAGTGYRIKDEAIVAAVQRAQKHVERLRGTTRREVEAEQRVRRSKDVRKAALNGKKRIVPNSGRPPAAPAPARRLKNAASDVDPVSAHLDKLLGALA